MQRAGRLSGSYIGSSFFGRFSAIRSASALNALTGQHRSVLEIRDFLSGEFEPLALAGLMEALCAQEKLGLVKFTEKPEASKPAAPEKKESKPLKKS